MESHFDTQEQQDLEDSDDEGMLEESNKEPDGDSEFGGAQRSEGHLEVLLARLEDSDSCERQEALVALGQLEPATIARHADAVVARLEDAQEFVRVAALETLAKLEPATLAQYADAVVAKLEDFEDFRVLVGALRTLGKLEPAALAQQANALIAMFDENEALFEMHDHDMSGNGILEVYMAALNTIHALPKFVTHGLNLNHLRIHCLNDDLDIGDIRSRLMGRLMWYRCRLRLRVRRLALYWYALPYRPSGPGHARDVEAWGRMYVM